MVECRQRGACPDRWAERLRKKGTVLGNIERAGGKINLSVVEENGNKHPKGVDK
jgi:hypothetical protein